MSRTYKKSVTSIAADIAAEPPLGPDVSANALVPVYVGIDIAKNAHVAAFVSAALIAKYGRHEKCPVLVFENSRAGFEKFFAVMTGYAPASECCVLLESTAHYGAALEQYLLEQAVTVYKMHVRARPETHKKTDKHDALSLANQIYNMISKGIQFDDKARQVRLVTPPTTPSLRLRGLVQRHYELGVEITRAKNKLTAIADEVFPEFTEIYKNPNTASALRLREKFPTPEAVAKASLADLYTTRIRNRPSNKQFVRFQELARQTIGTKNVDRLSSLTLEQGQLIRELRMLEEHQADLDEKIEKLLASSREGKILRSIAGVGTNCASVAIAVIGNIANFESEAKLRSYFGWSPEEVQTGVSLDHQFKAISGSRLMKKALYLAVLSATSHDTPWKILYDRLVPRMCIYDERTKKWKGKMKPIGRVAGQMTGMMYRLLRMDYELLSSIPTGVEPPAPTLYDEERHSRDLTRPLVQMGPKDAKRKRNSVSTSFKRFDDLVGLLPAGAVLVLNPEQSVMTLLIHGEIVKQIAFTWLELVLLEQLLAAWPSPCSNETLLAACSNISIDQAQVLVQKAAEQGTLNSLMYRVSKGMNCREKMAATGLDIEVSNGYQLIALSPVVS